MFREKILKLLILVFVVLMLPSCSIKKLSILKDKTTELKKEKVFKDVFYKMDKPNQRVNNRQKYFGHEYRKIKIRRKFNNFKTNFLNIKPQNIIGLGFSGGGIRSNAFQLGVMAGFNSIKDSKNRSMLRRIDYISSVSGGSWANGAYWINRVDDDLFFSCFDEVARGFGGIVKAECARYEPALRYEQFQVITRNLWLNAIINDSLMGSDLRFSQLNRKEYEYLQTKPYPIFNITHSAYVLENSTDENFPFEITPDYFGTIVDCGNGEKYCNQFRSKAFELVDNRLYKGFFVKQDGKNIKIWRELFFEKKGLESGDELSKALHTSSAVVGKLLSMDFNINYKNKNIKGIRDKYTLSDGGKSDNLGLTALVERGVDLIIISQMSSDPEVKFDDFKIAKRQVKKLLNRDININNFIKKGKKISLIEKASYSYRGKKEGNILIIKPTLYNVKEFYDYIENLKDEYGDYKYPLIMKALNEDKMVKKEWLDKKYDELKDFFSIPTGKKENLTKFPQTPTFQVKYPKHLIYAYYLLGKFIVKNHLKNELETIKSNFIEK